MHVCGRWRRRQSPVETFFSGLFTLQSATGGLTVGSCPQSESTVFKDCQQCSNLTSARCVITPSPLRRQETASGSSLRRPNICKTAIKAKGGFFEESKTLGYYHMFFTWLHDIFIFGFYVFSTHLQCRWETLCAYTDFPSYCLG